jgi:hypothetical protein
MTKETLHEQFVKYKKVFEGLTESVESVESAEPVKEGHPMDWVYASGGKVDLSPENTKMFKDLLPKAKEAAEAYKDILNEINRIANQDHLFTNKEWNSLKASDENFWRKASEKVNLSPSRIYLYLKKNFQ